MHDDFCLRFRGSHMWRHMPRPVLVGVWSEAPALPSDLLADWLLALCLQGEIACLCEGLELSLHRDQGLLLACDAHPCLEVPADGQVLIFAYAGAPAFSKEIIDALDSPLHLPVQSRSCQRLLAFARMRDQEELALSEHDGMVLVAGVLSGLIQHADRIDDARPQLVRQACLLIQQQVEEPYDASAIADRLQVTPNHFGRVFGEVMGISPGQYHKQQRLALAARLLKTSRLSIQAIAERLSYGNQSALARAFRSLYNMSPQEFRDHASVPIV